jgi:hypothetical protein
MQIIWKGYAKRLQILCICFDKVMYLYEYLQYNHTTKHCQLCSIRSETPGVLHQKLQRSSC